MSTRSERRLERSLDKHWAAHFRLLRELIQVHPRYADPGLDHAADAISLHLQDAGWEGVTIDSFRTGELKGDPDYVDVSQFGESFASDEDRPKKNVIASLDSGKPGPTLILNGHYDVDCVCTPEQWSQSDGWKSAAIRGDLLFGRGACDMLGGLCMCALAGSVLGECRKDWKGRILLTAVTDEEIGGNGTLRSLHWAREKGLIGETSYALIGEPSDHKVCVESLGFLHFRISVSRRSCHMGAAKRSNNAIWDLIAAINGFQSATDDAIQSQGVSRKSARAVVNIGMLRGGIDAAIPLGDATAEGVLFYSPFVKRSQLVADLRRVFAERFGTVKLSVSDFGFDGARFRSGRLAKALLENRSETPKIHHGVFRSPCDARLFKRHGIETVIYGPGQLRHAHSVDERVSIRELRLYADHVAKSLMELMAS